MVSEEINAGILTSMNEILTGVALTRDAKKSAVVSTKTRQHSAAPVKPAAPAVLDSPSTSNVAERSPAPTASKAPEKNAQSGGGSREEAKDITPPEQKKHEIRKYREQLRQMRRSMYGPDSAPSDRSASTIKHGDNAPNATPPNKEQQVVRYKSEDADDQDYDVYGSPIIKNSPATYRVTIDENHPDAIICPYWLESEASTNAEHSCDYPGDHEPYFHKVLDGKPKEPLECSFWHEGHCYRGSKCGFAHFRTRHGKVKDMTGKNDQKFPFTIAAEGASGTKRGLGDSRYARGNPTPALQKRDSPAPPGWEREDKALEDNTAKFRAFLGATSDKKPAPAEKKSSTTVAQSWDAPKNLPNHPGYNPSTFW